VAMAIVEDGRQLYSRRFDWHYSPGATQRAELLQRYSLVAHLAPEVRHGIDVVRAEHGVRVDAVVTCGDLPDLRSLIMPLIEELDIEVETLDTLDGIAVEGAAAGDAVADQAPAIRLACAAAAGSAASGSERWRLVAAAVVLLAILTGAWMLLRSLSGVRTDRGSQQARQPTTAPVRASRPPAATTRETASVTPPLAQSSARASAPATGRPAPAPPVPGSLESPASTTGRKSPSPGPAPAPAVQRRVPLSSPLPVVNSILVAPDRRLAVLDGEIVREGDAVGLRVLIRIEPRAVVLREPSGHEIRVPFRRNPG